MTRSSNILTKADRLAMMNSYILANCADILLGETKNGLTCPACLGGTSRDKSFSVTSMPYGYLYNCYRASCHFKGLLAAPGSLASPGSTAPSTPLKPAGAHEYTKDTIPLTSAQEVWFNVRFGITAQELQSAGVAYCPSTDSFAWPITDYRGYDVGVLDRAYWRRKPKTITYWKDTDSFNLYFPSGIKLFSPYVVLCEDVISAIKGTRYAPTVALLGTNLTELGAMHLARMFDKAIFALDGDATSVAIKLANKYNLYFRKGATLVQLSKDIKDMNYQELEATYIEMQTKL